MKTKILDRKHPNFRHQHTQSVNQSVIRQTQQKEKHENKKRDCRQLAAKIYRARPGRFFQIHPADKFRILSGTIF